MEQQDPLIGKQLGAYLVQEKLGEGGMARVYKAYHARLRRDVAIKVILSQIANRADFQARFEREAQVIANLEHRNIVAVYDFGELQHLTYLVMQYVGGGTLRDQLLSEHYLEPRKAANYALQMAQALHLAHQRGVVHRDVKPQNMLVSANDPNLLLLSDFGIAKLFDGSHETQAVFDMPSKGPSNSTLTSVDQIIGTADYMAPEQVNRQPVDARTDVYALGVVLYQMLTGRVPFQSTTDSGLMYQHVYTTPTPIRDINPRVPEALAQIVARAMEKAPSARFQSAQEMAQALEVFLTLNTNQLSAPFVADPTIRHTSVNNAIQQPGPGSFYGQPPAPNTPTFITPISVLPTYPTTTGAGVIPAPVRARPGIGRIVQIIVGVLLLMATLVFLVFRFLPTGSGGGSGVSSGGGIPQQNTVYNTSFTESFQDNTRGWPTSQAGLTGVVDETHHRYQLSVNDGNTYFPHPGPNGTSQGPLPTSFSLRVTMMQTQGATNLLCGLAFRITENGDTPFGYAVAITSQGKYEVLKYRGTSTPDVLGSGSFATIHQGLNQSNDIAVQVSPGAFFVKINGQKIVGNDGSSLLFSDKSSPFTGGQFGLFVSGSGSFTAQNVQYQKTS